MTDERYAPPIATVSDIADELPLPRPTQVVWAVRLLWATLILWVLQFWSDMESTPSVAAVVPVLVVESFMVAFAGYVNICIYRGRNWARILTLVLTILSTALVIFGPNDPTASTLEHVFAVVNSTSDVVCIYLLFASPGAGWFKKRMR